MKNALAEWQHKEMLSASNTGGYFAVVHPNDTVRQGGPGGALFGKAGRVKAVMARLGLLRYDTVWLDPVRYGGRGVARYGGAGQAC